MKYQSTRNKGLNVDSAHAVARGISAEGGLFVPVNLPAFSLNDIKKFTALSYQELAAEILSYFLTDFTKDELLDCANSAYSSDKFSGDIPAPVHILDEKNAVLELWHGPTCAFKDMALQILPHLMTRSAKKLCEDKEIIILVATSGDTGKAALEGFRDVPGIGILVFYPISGVSEMQKLQMITQEGENVAVCAVNGNFDDAQTGVKKIFTDSEILARLEQENKVFSSANSINWGRLVPQIVYYFSAYCQLLSKGCISLGDEVDFVVPTGNFGNILAGYYAKKMGLPVGKLVCASNSNNVLTDFFSFGEYNRNREFYTTQSPSMDILISSNLERLLFDLCGDDETIKKWMSSLTENGKYKVDRKVFDSCADTFAGGCAGEEQAKNALAEVFKKYGYLCDTHTAVAMAVGGEYSRGSKNFTVTLSTANPYKFPAAVLSALDPDNNAADDFEAAEALEKLSGAPIPKQLRGLDKKQIRFNNKTNPAEMSGEVLSLLGLSD